MAERAAACPVSALAVTIASLLGLAALRSLPAPTGEDSGGEEGGDEEDRTGG
jgi:hypothetical protein